MQNLDDGRDNLECGADNPDCGRRYLDCGADIQVSRMSPDISTIAFDLNPIMN
jgi:hypothetical protein